MRRLRWILIPLDVLGLLLVALLLLWSRHYHLPPTAFAHAGAQKDRYSVWTGGWWAAGKEAK
jgi:hypothetical protein